MRKLIIIILAIAMMILSCRAKDNSTANQNYNVNDDIEIKDDEIIISEESAIPDVPENFVFRPTIFLDDETNTAGTAFALRLSDEADTIIVTANHVFGKVGGFTETRPSIELKDHLKEVKLYGLFNDEYYLSVNKMVPISSAKSINGTDVAAFIVEDSSLFGSLVVADELPISGEYVWLVAKDLNNNDPNVILHRAVVSEYKEFANSLEFYYDNPNLSIQATSGAPIINSKGQVVGLNIGGYDDNGSVKGLACGILVLKELIDTSMEEM